MSKYKSYLLTKKMLGKRWNSYPPDSLDIFDDIFPGGIKVSNCTEEMVHRVSNLEFPKYNQWPYSNFYFWFMIALSSALDVPLSIAKHNYDLENIAYMLSDTGEEHWK